MNWPDSSARNETIERGAGRADRVIRPELGCGPQAAIHDNPNPADFPTASELQNGFGSLERIFYGFSFAP